MPKGKRKPQGDTPKHAETDALPRDSAISSTPSSEIIPIERETGDAKGSAMDKLGLRQRRFLKALTDPQSPTFDNQSASYALAYGHPDSRESGVRAHAARAVATGSVADALRQEIERQGLGPVVRVSKVSEIVDGRATTASESRTYKDPETGEVVTKTVAGVRPQDRLRALALLDKWDGTDARRQAESQARGTLLKGLADRLLRELSPPTTKAKRGTKASKAGRGATQGHADVDTHAQATEGTHEGADTQAQG